MIKYHNDIEQGSDEWLALRCGVLTASEIKHIMTPKTLKLSGGKDGGKECAHLYKILAQRIGGFLDHSYVGDDMLRGKEDEILARFLYEEKYGAVDDMGFITNDEFGFTIGYSPDGLVNIDGLIECKSRAPHLQMQAILDNTVPAEHILQCQTGLMVTKREWLDYLSYSSGYPMMRVRVYPDKELQESILNVCGEFEERLAKVMDDYLDVIDDKENFTPTTRKIEEEMII